MLSILSGTVDVDGSETPTFEVSAESILDQPVIQEESTMVESEMAIVQPTDSLPSTFDPSTKPKLQIEGSESLRQTDMANAGMFAGAAFQSTKIDSRLGQNRRQVAMARGGTPQSEQAVEDALVWLAAHQFADGGWSLHVDHPDCMGKCQHGTQDLDPKRVAATGLALLCFLGAGYTDQEGPYTEQVRKGIYFLTQKIRITSHGGQFTEAHVHSHMYEQGIATLALCEAYQMSRDQSFKNECQEAINYIRYAQHTDGGWDYNPKGPGDLSIACWQIMAMKSAVGAELTVPFDSIKAFDRFLDSQQTDGGAKYGYRVPMAKPSTTAMGLLMRMYRGWSKSDPRLMRGAKYIFEEGPSEYDVYLNYYATQVFFHMEGQYWEEWNPKLRDYLIRTQSQKGTKKGAGSSTADSIPLAVGSTRPPCAA